MIVSELQITYSRLWNVSQSKYKVSIFREGCNMKIKYIILIAVLAISCNNLESNNKLTTFEVKKSIPLEENSENIISYFNSVAIINNQVLFCDTGDGNLKVHDKHTGKHKRTIESSTKYSDTVAARKPDLSKTQSKDYYFPIINDSLNHSTQLDKNFQSSLCVFRKILNKNNNVDILAATKAVVTSKYNDKQKISNYVSIIEFDDDLDNLGQIIFEPRTSDYPTSDCFLSAKKYIYLSVCNNIRQYDNGKYDSLPAIAKYDLDGNFIKTQAYLDSNYEKTQYGYTLYHKVEMLEINDKFIYAFPYSGDIHVGDTSFILKNLPFTNRAGFQELFKSKGQFDKSDGGDGVFKYLPTLIKNLYKKDNHILSVLFQNKTSITKESCYYIQEYDLKGELLNQTKVITSNESGDLQHIHYEGSEDKFYLFRKSNEKGWIMEIAEWK